MEVVRRFLLHAVDSYETRNETGPTVSELAADLGLPPDFGHKHLVDHLRSEAALEHLANCRGRFTLTPAGRLALDDEARGHGSTRQGLPLAESAPSGRRG